MLQLGWASRDITPQRPAMIMGQMHRRIGRHAADPLTVTALAIDGGLASGRAILVSCDLTKISSRLQAAVAAQVQARLPELAGCPVVLNATHTHESPVFEEGYYPQPEGDVMTADEVRAWLAGQAAEAAVAAWNARRASRIGRAYAQAVVGHNRRAVYADGQVRMYGRTSETGFRHIEGHEDHGLDMIFAWDEAGRLDGLILDIPCPAQVDEQAEHFSADFWHDIRLELRQRLGQHLFVLPLCGAAGDISPHPMLRQRQEEEMRRRRGISERQEIAQRVADAVVRAHACTRPESGPTPVAASTVHVELPPRRITRAERDWSASHLKPDSPLDMWWPRRHREVVEAFDQDRPMKRIAVDLHLLRLGDAAIVTNPFELYLDYGERIRALSPAAQTLVVQLAAGSEIYLPSERAARAGAYGAHPVVAPVGPEGGEAVVAATLAGLANLFPSV